MCGERACERRRRVVGRHERLADALQQHQTHPPAQHLLIDTHVLEQGRGRDRGDTRRQSGQFHEPSHPFGRLRIQQPALTRHGRGHREPRADRLPVQPLPVGGRRLEHVPERMAEVEQRALALFTLVAADDCRLDLAGAHDDMGQGARLARQQRLQMRLEPLEELRIADQAVLDHLGEPGAQLPARQRAQRARVNTTRCGW